MYLQWHRIQVCWWTSGVCHYIKFGYSLEVRSAIWSHQENHQATVLAWHCLQEHGRIGSHIQDYARTSSMDCQSYEPSVRSANMVMGSAWVTHGLEFSNPYPFLHGITQNPQYSCHPQVHTPSTSLQPCKSSPHISMVYFVRYWGRMVVM